MKILVDADNCPVRDDVCGIASRRSLEVVLVCGPSNLLKEAPGVRVIEADSRSESADIVIANMVSATDIVVTSDIGLAALALGKGAGVLSPRGRIYERDTIARSLESRHIARKLRRSGLKTGGPPPFGPKDRKRFRAALLRLVALVSPKSSDA